MGIYGVVWDYHMVKVALFCNSLQATQKSLASDPPAATPPPHQGHQGRPGAETAGIAKDCVSTDMTLELPQNITFALWTLTQPGND